MKLKVTLFLMSLLVLHCEDHITDPEPTTDHKMYVYANSGQTLYLVDYTTFDVVKKITLKIPATVSSLGGMQLSTNRDYLVFQAIGHYPDPTFGFALYDIQQERLEKIFLTSMLGGGYFISAQNAQHPGLFYVHLRDFGTYVMDVFTQSEGVCISEEHGFSLGKRIFHSPNHQWTVVKKNWNIEGYTELEFYLFSSQLQEVAFVLNEGNTDSIAIDDFAFSDKEHLSITYQLSGGRSRDIANYFGEYNLETYEFSRTSLTLPWSLNPYYTAYSPTRDEVYTVGAYDTLYVIQPLAGQVDAKILLPGKVLGPSRTLLSPDEDVAFVSCSNTDAIYVIDLDEKTVVHVIELDHPYNMIIP